MAIDAGAFPKNTVHIWRGVGKGDEFRMEHITLDTVDKRDSSHSNSI